MTRSLLNAAQIVAGRHPLLVVLAGTPGLGRAMRSWGTSFVQRADFKRISAVSADDVIEGLVRPLAGREPPVAVRDDAAAAVADDCMGYPYFLQEWGSALERLDRPLIGMDEVELVRPRLAEARRQYYGDRWLELLEGGMVGAAEALVDAGLGTRELPLLEAEAVLEACFGSAGYGWDAVECALGTLQDLGFLWDESGESASFVAGIPSLARYVLGRAGSYTAARAAANFERRLERWREESRLLDRP